MIQQFPPDAVIRPGARVKFGIDPTLDRLHLGHFVSLRLVRKFLEEGHPVTIVLGTFTAQLGDPSGRESTRPVLSQQTVAENAERLLGQITKLLSPHGFSVFRNGDLFEEFPLNRFMQIASGFTVAEMLGRDSFRRRTEDGNSIGLHELLVPICQGWDSVHLQAEVEIGGQDQLFNFQVARELQVKAGQSPQVCLLTPIIRGTDGRKMSKTFGNCIFLDEEPNEMFGKVMSISDEVMSEWSGLLHDSPPADSPMAQKMSLAAGIVEQLHGLDAATSARDHFARTVQRKELPENIPTIVATTVIDAVCMICDCSRSHGRRLIDGGGVQIDGRKAVLLDEPVESGQLIRAGKRAFGRIQ